MVDHTQRGVLLTPLLTWQTKVLCMRALLAVGLALLTLLRPCGRRSDGVGGGGMMLAREKLRPCHSLQATSAVAARESDYCSCLDTFCTPQPTLLAASEILLTRLSAFHFPAAQTSNPEAWLAQGSRTLV